MRTYERIGGFQAWDGPFRCTDEQPYKDCPGADPKRFPNGHLHCDGPLENGTPLRFERKRKQPKGGMLFQPANLPEEGVGRMRIHWHYEGCMIEVVMADGTEVDLCAQMGDKIWVLPQVPDELKLDKHAVQGVL